MSEASNDSKGISLQLTQSASLIERSIAFVHYKKNYLLVLLLLVVLLVLVFVYLPRWAANNEAVNIEQIRTQAQQKQTTKAIDESPFQQAQQAKYRQQAQTILAQVIEQQKILEQKKVLLWQKTGFELAVTTAQRGDQLYREQAFNQAIEQYQQALLAMQQIVAQVPEQFHYYFTQAKQSIEQNQIQQAINQAQIALYLMPENEQAQQTMFQAEALAKVNKLLQRGDDLIKEQKFEQAKAQYKQAVKADPYSQKAAQKLAQVEQTIREHAFSSLMAKGYQQLTDHKFQQALASFNQAKRFNLNATQVQDALTQVKSEQQAQQLVELLTQAQQFEQQEQWQKAEQSYQQMLALDTSLVSAKVGKLRAKARTQLEQALLAIIKKPLALADPIRYQQAGNTLTDAKKIKQQGTQLRRQIAQVSQILTQVAQPILVNIVSDNATKIEILRVSELGQFTQKRIRLTPGVYTIIGSRIGYKDVQKTLTVSLNNNAVTMNIACTEKIGG